MAINDGQPFLARECDHIGLSQYELREARNEQAVRKVFNGVYVDAAAADTRQLRIAAVKLVAPPYAVASDGTAAWVWGVNASPPNERHILVPKLVVPHSLTRLVPAEGLCRQAKLPESDITEIDGLRLTTPIRTTADFLRRLWRPYAMGAADAMAHADLIDVEELQDYLKRLRGYRGIRQARNLAQLIEPLAGSHGESWQRLRMTDAGFPRPVPQYEVTDEQGNSRFFDHAYPELLLVAEYDGREFHTADVDKAHDYSRRGYFEKRFGWRFLISRKADIFGSDPAFEIELGKLYGREPWLPRSW